MIAMWILANLLGMECKWLLLIPFEHSAYVGLIADAYAREQGVWGSDMCTCEAVLSTAFAVCLCCRTWTWLFCVLVLRIILRYAEFISIYNLYFKHKYVLAFLSLIPGVSLLCALKVRRGVC